jgi:hypothetical protein
LKVERIYKYLDIPGSLIIFCVTCAVSLTSDANASPMSSTEGELDFLKLTSNFYYEKLYLFSKSNGLVSTFFLRSETGGPNNQPAFGSPARSCSSFRQLLPSGRPSLGIRIQSAGPRSRRPRQRHRSLFIWDVKCNGGPRAAGINIPWVGTSLISGVPEDVVCSDNLKQPGRQPGSCSFQERTAGQQC